MKKQKLYLGMLGMGALTTIIPLVAVVSCGSNESNKFSRKIWTKFKGGIEFYHGKNFTITKNLDETTDLQFKFSREAWTQFTYFNCSRFNGATRDSQWTARVGDFWQFVCEGSLNGDGDWSNIRANDSRFVKEYARSGAFEYNEFEKHFIAKQSNLLTNTQIANKLSILPTAIPFSRQLYHAIWKMNDPTVRLNLKEVTINIKMKYGFTYISSSVDMQH